MQARLVPSVPALLLLPTVALLGKSGRRAKKPARPAGPKCQESLMSIRAIPLLVLAFVLYNAIVLTLGRRHSTSRFSRSSF